ncbi:hypothetical protein ACTXT7_016642, partial [Hymenolepis weldensis]
MIHHNFALEQLGSELYNMSVNLLTNMAQVRNVTFSRNFFSVFPPGGREQYSHVTSLNMDHNRITVVPPDVLSHLDQVTKLNLRDNEIANLHPEG